MPPFSNRAAANWLSVSLGLGLTAIGLSTTSALFTKTLQAQVPPGGTFTATQSCPAQRAINGPNPGNVALQVGTQYMALGFNRSQGQYVLLKVPGANPEQRWVAVNCGDFQAATQTPTPTPSSDPGPSPSPTGSSDTGLLPFFDTLDNPVPVNFPRGAEKDITPAPPTLQPFDQKILALCGAEFGSPVSAQKFRQLLTFYPDVVLKLKMAANGAIKPNRRANTAFLDDVTAIWFEQKAFQHIFCGEREGKSIGGLHFVGRYLEFQQKGMAGRILRTSDGKPSTQEVVDGEIYTFGVAIVQNGRRIAEHPIKGYAYTLDAQDILLDATRAFTLFKSTSQDSRACLYTVSEPPAAPFQAVFVKKAGAIRTFYPDATPGDSRTDGPCGN